MRPAPFDYVPSASRSAWNSAQDAIPLNHETQNTHHIGGARALDALGIKPTIWHMNEGHAAFLVLERMRRLMR